MGSAAKFHLSRQHAEALLYPMRSTLVELERRASHYLERLHLDQADEIRLRAARDALARARTEIEQLYHEAVTEQGKGGEES